jgi:hypothetical protein
LILVATSFADQSPNAPRTLRVVRGFGTRQRRSFFHSPSWRAGHDNGAVHALASFFKRGWVRLRVAFRLSGTVLAEDKRLKIGQSPAPARFDSKHKDRRQNLVNGPNLTARDSMSKSFKSPSQGGFNAEKIRKNIGLIPF